MLYYKGIHNLVFGVPITQIGQIHHRKDVSADEQITAAFFIRAIMPSIEVINRLIGDYNLERNETEKRQYLSAIYDAMYELNNRCSDDVTAYCVDYVSQIDGRLFEEMKRESEILGIESMHPSSLHNPEHSFLPGDIFSPSEVFANMSPQVISRLGALLADGKSMDVAALQTLYGLDEGGADSFYIFLDEYTVRSVSSGNSKNFILKHIVSQKKYFLKLEDRLGMPKQVEHHLRSNGLEDVFTPILVERKVAFTDQKANETVIRRLVVTTVCEGEDLETVSKKQVTNEARTNAAIDVYKQMASVLANIETNGCVFTDMKNSNWLLDESGQIKISDTKGFLFTNKLGQLDVDDIAGKNGSYGNVPNTPYMNPEEMFSRKPRPSAEKLHAYMLGKNLYQYLTGCSASYFLTNSKHRYSAVKRVSQLSFSSDIFKSEQGHDLARLIQSLMDPIPQKRPSVETAYQELRTIEQNSPDKLAERGELWNGCLKLMDDLEDLSRQKYGQVLHEVKQAIYNFELRADADSTIESLQVIQGELQGLITDFEAIQEKKTLRADCLNLILQIKMYEFKAGGVRDVEMEALTTAMSQKMWDTDTSKDLEALRVELEETLDVIGKNQAIYAELEALIKQDKYGMAEKGRRIAEAFVRVPPRERGRILEVREGGSEATEAVLKEMASSRLLPRFLHFVREGKGGHLDPEKAATTFKIFKEKHRDRVLGRANDSTPEDEIDTPHQ